ncbi:hypothetical protein A3K29_03675 [Candidatus Collierbacteria bacterium RIFOXYB2_FULL_46_14]|uniref:Isopentenyl phosphate kinase n=1 Tax=Candidatus Collierbacteria bacterium GW2011_GWA2_46_26 TaxID=1618381 RepID=A0A0G1SHC2_9BACT|nr:MAG: Aspartate/glutamate/uridylate kinase [Candidatus Collierbacteria bacterium GW2011_GWC2_44_13]KKU32710.1 MAG: Aspartate/glutamate/uridylate kinase [Candidatus Collierbacteria bacterium GW2011_GWA2_46_26]OGD73215.1 MAG: hypothetical protein A3K29_03675 [Candidatus Collierbacteria bacterium RIFOXYB2_FULL_46_14]OGD76257.1 MAG: hypothetical protein A3K43_03675 [Candidatus Collierbacteria bacterium RIFOXYA2_FULL_46_20]OGD77593.1 MAG: hypothetical protein A3K39_03675 [Candidatus Collierbacteri
MERLVLIKLGGSLITDKSIDRTSRPGTICRLAGELKKIRKTFDGKILVAHGAGSFAHRPAVEFRVKDGIKGPLQFKGFPIVADRAIELNRIIIKNFLDQKLPAVSFSPESCILASNFKVEEVFCVPIEQALKVGYIPVLYGDVIFDKKVGACIYSTELVLGALAGKLAKKFRISFVYCTDTDGVFDSTGKTLPEINHKNIKEVEKFITGSGQIDVTGGMVHKVRESLAMADKGFETIIINGNRPNELSKAILGDKHHGTHIRY